MKNETILIERIQELKAVVDDIQNKASKELAKKRPEMNIYLLRFLNQERLVYEFALSNLEWVLKGND